MERENPITIPDADQDKPSDGTGTAGSIERLRAAIHDALLTATFASDIDGESVEYSLSDVLAVALHVRGREIEDPQPPGREPVGRV